MVYTLTFFLFKMQFGSCTIHILYIYSTNIGTEYFKHGIYSQFCFSSRCSLFHNSNVFGSCIIHILYTGVLKLKKKFRLQKVNHVFRYTVMSGEQLLLLSTLCAGELVRWFTIPLVLVQLKCFACGFAVRA